MKRLILELAVERKTKPPPSSALTKICGACVYRKGGRITWLKLSDISWPLVSGMLEDTHVTD